MRVRARAIDLAAVPPVGQPFVNEKNIGQTLIMVSPGREYEVHAMAVGGSIVFLQIVGDVPDWPVWVESWWFEIIDPTLPKDWICSFFEPDASDVILVLGPEFIARTKEDYEAMVDLHSDKQHQFWERLRVMERDESSR